MMERDLTKMASDEEGYWGTEVEVDWEDAAYVYVVARSGSSVLGMPLYDPYEMLITIS